MLLHARKIFSSSFSISASFAPQILTTLRHHHFPELVHRHFLDESVEWRAGVCTLVLLLYNFIFFFFWMLAQSLIIFYQFIFVSILPFIHAYFTLLDGL